MRGGRFGLCVALVVSACFAEAPNVGTTNDADASDGTSTASTSMPSTSTPTSTSAGTVDATSSEPTSSASTMGVTSVDTVTMTTDSSAGDVTTTPATDAESGAGDCYVLDFEAEMLACVNGDLALPIGLAQVTFTNAAGSPNPGPCIENAIDDDTWTAPFASQYLWLQISSNTAATLVFTQPVLTASLLVGPHYPEGTMANVQICGTLAGQCENPTAFGNESAAGTLAMDLEGGTTLYIFMNDGVANLAIDDLEVCF